MPNHYYHSGTPVQGTITGRYLGIIIKAFPDRVYIRGPDRTVFDMSPAFIEPVTNGRNRK